MRHHRDELVLQAVGLSQRGSLGCLLNQSSVLDSDGELVGYRFQDGRVLLVKGVFSLALYLQQSKLPILKVDRNEHIREHTARGKRFEEWGAFLPGVSRQENRVRSQQRLLRGQVPSQHSAAITILRFTCHL